VRAGWLSRPCWLEQAIDRHLKRQGELLDVVQGDIASLSLHVGYEGAMKAGLEGQCLLAEATLLPQTNHIERQQLSGWRRRDGFGLRQGHGVKSSRMLLLSQPRLRHNRLTMPDAKELAVGPAQIECRAWFMSKEGSDAAQL
jgi:hypothetical protein